MVEIKLEEIYIKNYLSLCDVVFPLKPLTILVGPNSSGKSNILNALDLMRKMVNSENLPPAEYLKDRIWAGGANSIHFQFKIKIDDNNSCYTIELSPEEKNQLKQENLTINDIDVITITNGEGKVKDEDGSNSIDYKSKKLALASAGDYGKKPVTRQISQFIKNWEFYNFNPDQIRRHGIGIESLFSKISNSEKRKIPFPEKLDDDGTNLRYLLAGLKENESVIFNTIKQFFEKHTKFKFDFDEQEEKLKFYEGYQNSISINRISDGTLRLLAYLTLNHQPELPSLLAIEEPERNLHPAWLGVLSDILNQLSHKTQVIITTHSSQLLDSFGAEELGDNLGVLLLHNVFGKGTEIATLDDMRKNRAGLQDWIDEFGIGSAIFHSEMLQDIMQKTGE